MTGISAFYGLLRRFQEKDDEEAMKLCELALTNEKDENLKKQFILDFNKILNMKAQTKPDDK